MSQPIDLSVTTHQDAAARICLLEVPQQEEVAHIGEEVHTSVHPRAAQPMAPHGEHSARGVADAACGITRQQQEHALRPAEAAADADVRRHAYAHHHEVQRAAPCVASRVDPVDNRGEKHLAWVCNAAQ